MFTSAKVYDYHAVTHRNRNGRLLAYVPSIEIDVGSYTYKKKSTDRFYKKAN